jgi:hypothetical protein
MSLNPSEEIRLQRLETAVAELATALKNLASKRQLNHINTLTERQITELKIQIASLQSQLDALKK